MPALSTILFFVWAAAMVVAMWSWRVAQFYGRKMPPAAQKPLAGPTPPVAVIVPIKGVDADTPGNLAALLEQDYPRYRLIFAVEAADDPVVPLLEKLAAGRAAGGAKKAEGASGTGPNGAGKAGGWEGGGGGAGGVVEIVVAGVAEDRGQKVHNQLAAVERTTDADEILAFMDADAQPGPNWLRALVLPLNYGSHIGATTGYRFYVPETPHLANHVVSVINGGVGVLFGPYRRTFAWGGSMAVRRQDFFEYGIHSAWQHALSDDYVLSWCVKHRAGRKIHFVPQCVVGSGANFNWGTFFEFAVRQYRITRVCAPFVWVAAVMGPILFLFGLAYTLGRAAYGLVQPFPEMPYEPLRNLIMFAGLYGCSVWRGSMLLRAAQQLLPQHAAALERSGFWFTLGYPLVQAVNLAALVGSAFGRSILWRGVSYTMVSRTRTRAHRPVIIGGMPAGKAPGEPADEMLEERV